MTRITTGEVLMGLLAIGLFAFAPPTTASAQSVTDLAQMCAGCHGEKGVPIEKTIPVIWGQNRTYLLNELHDFHSGRRKNEQMSPIAESLSRSDIAALATYFSNKPWPKLDQPAPPPDVQKTARSVLDTINCRACHQDQYQGDTTRPRLAGQQKEYLLKTMRDFREKHRTNYMGMVALMNAVSEENLEPVAAYLASLKLDEDSK